MTCFVLVLPHVHGYAKRGWWCFCIFLVRLAFDTLLDICSVLRQLLTQSVHLWSIPTASYLQFYRYIDPYSYPSIRSLSLFDRRCRGWAPRRPPAYRLLAWPHLSLLLACPLHGWPPRSPRLASWHPVSPPPSHRRGSRSGSGS